MNSNNNIPTQNILENLEGFYKKFYFNRLVKGVIVSTGIVLSFFLFFDLLIFYGQLPTAVRFILFYGFVLILLSALYFGVVDPVLRLFKINKGISSEEAAQYIGTHYAQIGDKLLNTLQFAQTSEKNALMTASIASRAEFLSPFEFSKAVPPIEKKKNAFILLIPISLLLVILTFNKRVVTDGATQMINYSVDYSAIAPFNFEVYPGNIELNSGTSTTLDVKLVGEDLPKEVFVEMDGVLYRANGERGEFKFNVENITSDITYRFKANKFFSESYTIVVIPNPLVSDVKLVVEYPDYTQKTRSSFSNPSLLELPEGSKLFWEFSIKDAQQANLTINGETIEGVSLQKFKLIHNHRLTENQNYIVELKSPKGNFQNGFESQVLLIKDNYPSIDMKTQIDSSQLDYVYFYGRVQDDYGFHSLTANFVSEDSSWTTNLPINKQSSQDVFTLQVNKTTLKANTAVTFEIRDNDQIHGYKQTTSAPYKMDVLNGLQQDSALNSQGDELLKEMKDLAEKSDQLNKEIKAAEQDLLNKKNIDWENQKKLEKSSLFSPPCRVIGGQKS